MTFQEKSAWIMAVIALVVYGGYATTIVGRAGGAAGLTEVAYVWPMVLATVAWIIGAIVLHVLAAIAAPRDAEARDQRDREINRFGEYVGQYLVVLGGVAALIMAMVELEHFWIANALFLAFALASLAGSVAKVVFYRRGLPAW